MNTQENLKEILQDIGLEYLSDFSESLVMLDHILREGAKKEGRHRGQWRDDRSKSFHLAKAISHARLAMGIACDSGGEFYIDKDTGLPHNYLSTARSLIAMQRNIEESS